MKCKFCAGEISDGVAKCRHCGEWLDSGDFISMINSSKSFHLFEEALTAKITENINSKFKGKLNFVVPAILFLLGGAGVITFRSTLAGLENDIRKTISSEIKEIDAHFLEAKEAIDKAKNMVDKTDFVVSNAKDAIEKAQEAEQSIQSLEESKKTLQEEIGQFQINIEGLRKELSGIAVKNMDLLYQRTEKIETAIIDINKRLIKTEGNEQHQPAVAIDFSSKEEDDIKQNLEMKAKFVKYVIQVGKYNDMLPSEVVSSSLQPYFTVILHNFQNPPEDGVKYNSITIGRKIPDDVISYFFKILYKIRDDLKIDYVRFNKDSSQDERIFVGSQSKISIDRGDIKVSDDIWNKLQSNDSRRVIEKLEGKESVRELTAP